MQYLQHNKVNYLSNNKDIVFGSSISSLNSTQAYIIYTDVNTFQDSSFYQNTYATQQGNSFVIYSDSASKYVNNIIFIIRPSFTCSDIMSIANDNITFIVSYTLNDNSTVTKEYVYPLDKQYINTYNLYDCININNTIKSFTISATSDIDLTLLPPKIITSDKNNVVTVTVVYM